ncbi:hypothetical protein EVAR_43689_1 [Eumeta japonica]|uniref:Uncharacterized protein n=1 Tax=Eumeta variegata TaxID=151549 RepID=A0A4C1WWS6_EUMVA|nr:hypothetical protein EVAR_43689_1 [Eumeta japonica]
MTFVVLNIPYRIPKPTYRLPRLFANQSETEGGRESSFSVLHPSAAINDDSRLPSWRTAEQQTAVLIGVGGGRRRRDIARYLLIRPPAQCRPECRPDGPHSCSNAAFSPIDCRDAELTTSARSYDSRGVCLVGGR